MERLSYAASKLSSHKTSVNTLPRTRSLPTFFGRPGSYTAIFKVLPAKPDPELMLADPKRLPAGYTHKFQRMTPEDYKRTMEQTWDSTLKEQAALRREAQLAIVAGFLDHRTQAKQVKIQINPQMPIGVGNRIISSLF